MKKIAMLAVTVFFALSIYSGSANAAEPNPASGSASASEDSYKTPGVLDPALSHFASDDEKVIDDGYVVPTIKNLSKLYWVLAMFDLGDNQAIDGYLMINQCDMYKKFYRSDFELEGLREATRQSIQRNMSKFPMTFEIMIPVGLDRYNIGTEKFALDPRSQFLGARRLEIAVNNNFGRLCDLNNIPKYPRNFILSLSRPLVVTDIPVEPEVAQAFLEQQDKEAASHSYRFALSKYSRVAYLRLTVKMNQFKGYTKPDTSTPSMAEVFGTIDGFEMYGDRDKTLLLFNQKIERERMAKRASQRAMSMPNGQLIESQDVDSGGNVIKMTSAAAAINKASPETGQVEAPRFDIPSAAAPARAPVKAPQAATPGPAPAAK